MKYAEVEVAEETKRRKRRRLSKFSLEHFPPEVIEWMLEPRRHWWKLLIFCFVGLFTYILLGYVITISIQIIYSAVSSHPEKFFDESLFFTLWLAEVPIGIIVGLILFGRERRREAELAKLVAVAVHQAFEEERNRNATSTS